MRTVRITTIGLLAAMLFVNLGVNVVLSDRDRVEHLNRPAQMTQPTPISDPQGYAEEAIRPQGAEPNPVVAHLEAMQLTLTASNFTTSRDERDPNGQRFALPLLYLHRQRDAADAAVRTLEISITGLEAGVAVEIQAISRRADRSTGEPRVATTRFVSLQRPCTPEFPCTLRWTFDAATTLSDFYNLQVKDEAGALLWQSVHGDRPDFVALDTWDVAIDDYVVRIYYATLFPFAKGEHDLKNRLVPGSVVDFIEYVFVPMVLETWKTQMRDWGFGDPIHPDWDRDRVVEIIITDPPFALFDGTGPYTVLIDGQRNPYSERRIWWPASCNNFYMYDFLPNGYKVMFAHEFFHLAQWNVLLTTGHPTNFAQNLFLEAQAAFAPSVQFPDIEIDGRHVIRDLGEERAANRFLTQRLNSSYAELEADTTNKYDAGLYWRFLYEQFNGMDVIRAALEEMPHHLEADPVGAMGSIMDRALARVDGPFDTFAQSLVGFARANYALGLESGRCNTQDFSKCQGRYYDPNGGYATPPLEVSLKYAGEPLIYSGAIPASYGMDFVEVQLQAAVHGQALKISFQGQTPVTQFNLQVWQLASGTEQGTARPVSLQPEIVAQSDDGTYSYLIRQIDLKAYDRLALIITRLDADEMKDPTGSYQLTLEDSQ